MFGRLPDAEMGPKVSSPGAARLNYTVLLPLLGGGFQNISQPRPKKCKGYGNGAKRKRHDECLRNRTSERRLAATA